MAMNRWVSSTYNINLFTKTFRWTRKPKRSTKRKIKKVDKANLEGVDLDRLFIDLEGANLYRADLREADLRWANLYEANLERADLRWANLYGANLREANLRRTNFGAANLRRANLEGANLEGADLYEANLNGANLLGIKIDDGQGNVYECQKDGWSIIGNIAA